jgi:septum formation protein
VTKLVLASTSPARKKLLQEAGIVFETVAPGVDEDALVATQKPSTAHDLTALLAKAKAKAVTHNHPNSLVLGCDSALEFDGEILGKPYQPAVAIERWKKMRGNSGFLYSGHHLIDTSTKLGVSAVSKTEVHFANLSDQEIQRYVDTGEPLQVAGAFTIDGIGGAYVEKIIGDYHTVVGLSLVELRKMVTDLGHQYQDLWR